MNGLNLTGGSPLSNRPLIEPQKSETVSRQRMRYALRLKAKRDIAEQYGKGHNALGYDPRFPRRARRKAVTRMCGRWYAQIRAASEHVEGKRAALPVRLFRAMSNKLLFGAPLDNSLQGAGIEF